MTRNFLGILPLFLVLVGCSPTPIGPPTGVAIPPPIEPGGNFDPVRTGTLSGRVTWLGDVPQVPKLDAVRTEGGENPLAPKVNAKNQGVAGAVVFLRNLDPAIGRPWDLPTVRVEFDSQAIRVISGNGEPRAVGFVRRGDSVAMASTQTGHRMLRARGAAFFTLPFPEPGQPLNRSFDRPGWVSLSSGSGEFWEVAELFVCDHPYYTLTDSDGAFTLPQVPFGERELVVWARNWNVIGRDRSPETGIVTRVQFAEPVEKSVRVTVGERSEPVNVTFSTDDFTRPVSR